MTVSFDYYVLIILQENLCWSHLGFRDISKNQEGHLYWSNDGCLSERVWTVQSDPVNTLSPDIHLKILQTDLHTFP